MVLLDALLNESEGDCLSWCYVTGIAPHFEYANHVEQGWIHTGFHLFRKSVRYFIVQKPTRKGTLQS